MIQTFLRAKHWQLFLVVFCLPFLFHLGIMITMFSTIINQHSHNPEAMLDSMSIIFVVMLIYMALQFGWLWSVAIGLQKWLPESVKMKVTRFKIFLLVPFLYICLFCVLMSGPNGLMGGETEPDITLIMSLFFFIVPMHFFSVFCIFYSIYFVVKTIKSVELQRKVNFGDFIGEFFMVWFYPIGIWVLQPKINAIIKQDRITANPG